MGGSPQPAHERDAPGDPIKGLWTGRRRDPQLDTDLQALLSPDPLRQLRGQELDPELIGRWLARAWPLSVSLPDGPLPLPEADLLLRLLITRQRRSQESAAQRGARLRMTSPTSPVPEAERKLAASFRRWLETTPALPVQSREDERLHVGLDALCALLTSHPDVRAELIRMLNEACGTRLTDLMEHNLVARDSLGSGLGPRDAGTQDVVREQTALTLPGDRWNSAKMVSREALHQQTHTLHPGYRAALSDHWRAQLRRNPALTGPFGLLALMRLRGPHPAPAPAGTETHDALIYWPGGGSDWAEHLTAPQPQREGRAITRGEQWAAALLGSDPFGLDSPESSPLVLTGEQRLFPRELSRVVERADLHPLLEAGHIIHALIEERLEETTTHDALRRLRHLTRSLQRAQAFQELAVQEQDWLQNLVRRVGRQEVEAPVQETP